MCSGHPTFMKLRLQSLLITYIPKYLSVVIIIHTFLQENFMVAGSKPSFFILFSGSVKKWPAGDDGLGVHAHSANVVSRRGHRTHR